MYGQFSNKILTKSLNEYIYESSKFFLYNDRATEIKDKES